MTDIGKFFEDRLSDGKKKPSNDVWEKIDKSLTAERQKRKKIFYTSLVGGGLVSIFLLFLLFTNEGIIQNISPNQEKNNPITKRVEHSSESSVKYTEDNIEKKISSNISKKEHTSLTPEIEEEFSQPNNLNSVSGLGKGENQSVHNKKIHEAKTKRNLDNKPSMDQFEDESFIVSKNYYYYNSEDGSAIITKNKKEIDSIIADKNKARDTINSLKIKNLHH